MLSTELGRLRIVALSEGVSFLILLGIAMPLKYVWGEPAAVSAVGMIHGLLSMVLVLCLFLAHLEYRWSILFSIKVFVSSLIPFGAFWMDRELAQLSAEQSKEESKEEESKEEESKEEKVSQETSQKSPSQQK